MKTPQLGILVLAYHAEDTIQDVLRRIPEETYALAKGIYVFDDASKDATTATALAFKEKHPFGNKIHVTTHPKNLGYGGNQKYSYRFAQKEGLDAVVMLHGDGQYAPELLPQIYSPILQGNADLVFGSRMSGKPIAGKMPLHKFIGNVLLTRVQNLIAGTHFTEYHSGYRAFRTKCFDAIPLDACTNGFHFDTQVLILFHDRKFHIQEMPIPTFYGQEISRVKIFSYGLSVLRETAEYRVQKLLGQQGLYTQPLEKTPLPATDSIPVR